MPKAPTSIRTGPVWLLAGWFLVFWLAPARAEEGATAPRFPSTSGYLVVTGRQPVSLPLSSTPAGGTLFGLATIAEQLGVELRVGPLGNSHRLIFDQREVIVGPERAVMVTVTRGGSQEQITLFSQTPDRGPEGLRVPLDFLTAAFADELDIDFQWDSDRRVLSVRRRQVRELSAVVDVVHQYTSTVEIRFPDLESFEEPRYRIERRADSLTIRMTGDRLRVPVASSRTESPLVRGIVATVDAIRIDLAEGAGAAEPRLLRSPSVRLIVEVFRERVAGAEEKEEEVSTARDDGVRIIVIDPGHGGVETGAVGPGKTAEKDLTLLVSRALKRQLERRLSVRVVLTRSSDVDLPLDTRTAIANHNKADLFISVHFNSAFGAGIQGAETYFLSREASDERAAEAAAAENLAAGTTDDPELDLQLILWDLAQSYHLAESQRFANLVQEELNQTLGLRDRGVKQAPFRVLMGAQMPAVLVELGFLNDPDEERKLQSPVYRADLVDALLRAVIRFKKQLETRASSEIAE